MRSSFVYLHFFPIQSQNVILSWYIRFIVVKHSQHNRLTDIILFSSSSYDDNNDFFEQRMKTEKKKRNSISELCLFVSLLLFIVVWISSRRVFLNLNMYLLYFVTGIFFFFISTLICIFFEFFLCLSLFGFGFFLFGSKRPFISSSDTLEFGEMLV